MLFTSIFMYPSVCLSTWTYAATDSCVDGVCVSGTLTSLWEYQWPIQAIPPPNRCKLAPLVNSSWVTWGTFLFQWLVGLSPKAAPFLIRAAGEASPPFPANSRHSAFSEAELHCTLYPTPHTFLECLHCASVLLGVMCSEC